MFTQKRLLLKMISSAIIIFEMIQCFPLETASELPVNGPIEIKNETRFPNGTVFGAFTYNDSDGSPINVKYYADDSSYGIELKSLKTYNPNKEMPWKAHSYEPIKPAAHILKPTTKLNLVQEDKHKKSVFKNDKKLLTKSNDYETFYRNDIKGLTKCNKDKVRVYLDREKKIIRRALDNYQAGKTCGRY